MEYLPLLQHVTNSRWASPFFSGGNTLELIINHLNPFTLRFKNNNLERHYYAFANENSAFYIGVGAFFSALIFLVYIPLDASLICFSITIRQHCIHVTTLLFITSIVAAMASLIFRNDLGFSPLFCVLLWGNSHFASFSFSRTITSTLMIIAQALVWIFYLEKDARTHLRDQTLSYALFCVGIIITGYGREIVHRRVYMQIHTMLHSQVDLKRYSVMLSSSTKNMLVNSKSRNSVAVKSPSVSVVSPAPAPPTLSASGELPIFIPPPTQGATLEVSDHPNFIPNTPSFDSPQSPTLVQNYNYSPEYFRTTSDLYGTVQDSFSKFLDKVKGVFDFCLPARGEAVMSDVGYHRTVYLYVTKLTHRVTLKFRDPSREIQFREWYLEDTAPSVRRFIILNIISIISLLAHDLNIDSLTQSEEMILTILRFCVIIPALIVALVFSLLPQFRKWRGTCSTILEIICAGCSLAMGLYAYTVSEPRIGAAAGLAYDLYFGYVVRFVVYGFCGMGLLWMQSTIMAAIILIAMFITTTLLGVPLALTPLIIIVIGFTIAYNEEKARRVEFYLQFFNEEILVYVRAKELNESSELPSENSEEVMP